MFGHFDAVDGAFKGKAQLLIGMIFKPCIQFDSYCAFILNFAGQNETDAVLVKNNGFVPGPTQNHVIFFGAGCCGKGAERAGHKKNQQKPKIG